MRLNNIFFIIGLSVFACLGSAHATKGEEKNSLATESEDGGQALRRTGSSHSAPLFEVGKVYKFKKTPEIYLQYAEEVNEEPVLGFRKIEYGFKIFKSDEEEEVGFIVSKYRPQNGDIHVEALWIKEERRRHGYGSTAMKTLMALHQFKKASLPQARYFSFYTDFKNEAMFKIAHNMGFKKDTYICRILGLKDGEFLIRPFQERL